MINEKKLILIIKWIVSGGIIIFLATICTYYYRGHISIYNDIDPAIIGTFGDFVGGFIGTFFALATTFLVWLTYNSQKKELEKTSDLAEKQYQTLTQQQFESTFFNLLTMQSGITQRLQKTHHDISDNSSTSLKMYSDYGYFDYLYGELKKTYHKVENEEPPYIRRKDEGELTSESIINDAFRHTYENHKFEISHYLRSLINIIQFIEDANIENKSKYVGILRSQLSDYEILILFYFGLSTIESELKTLIEKNHLLKDLLEEELINGEHIKFYNITAYEKYS